MLRYLPILAASLAAVPVSASCDDADYSVAGEFRRSDLVVLVRATGVTWLDDNRRPVKLRQPLSFGNMPGGLDPYLGAYYDVTLEKAYKGRPPRRFRIFSENTTARTPLLMGKPLLLFVTRTRTADAYVQVGDLTVDNCGNSARADRMPQRLREVARLAAQRRKPRRKL
ncbi:MAG: hypothetical protein KF730_01835 [Sphingomonas sp.]|uniref:hypothetical protein n=1 Tax=Sphingomonas sp. TaxID=28214 RepID=UPI0025ED45FD|nr:hypothetical protein [Sphingomonas sp.]MBX3563293.1 hypothetical protein [Sphingomonas sp.]